jgi:hypothetical protein
MRLCFSLFLFLFWINQSFAVVKTTQSNGNWSNASLWSPAGVPVQGDEVVIASHHQIVVDQIAYCKSLTIDVNASLKIAPAITLNLNGNLLLDGVFDFNGGNVEQLSSNAALNVGANGVLIWNPGNNTVSGATLLTRSVESLNPMSTLVISKWYAYSTVPLGSVISGDFGNVTISTQVGNTLFEWNQNNEFEKHQIKGILTIDNGWVVLDKSGSINETKIGGIVLSNMNSVLEFHSGSHPSSFKVITDSIANNGGELNGIINGNGNIELIVNKGFLNMGNVELIYNAGVLNIGNGNAKLLVGGLFKQTHGDFRGVFNLSSTSAGKVDLDIHSLNMSGGLFFAFYGCNAVGHTNTVLIRNTFSLNLMNATDKFRINGLTTLMGQYSKAKSLFQVKGDAYLGGNASAEFTSSGSIGIEDNIFLGNVTIAGLNNNFNYGSHAVTIKVMGSMTINGGNTCLSKTPGSALYDFNQLVYLSAGNFILKANEGKVVAAFNGDYKQNGGVFFLHSNIITPTSDSIEVIVKGAFSLINGVINFDDHLSGSNKSLIRIRGNEFIVKGNSLITRAGSGTGAVFGIIRYETLGVLSYKRGGSSGIDQIKQVVGSSCNMMIDEGLFVLSSHNTPSYDFLIVESGGVLDLRTSQIISNIRYARSGLTINKSATLKLANTKGLYNSIGTAAISNAGNMQLYLDPESIVEYNGANQLLTSFEQGGVTPVHQKYGKLIVRAKVSLTEPVFIRNSCEVINGSINLNRNTFTLENGSSDAIQFNSGSIICSTDKDRFKWMGMKKLSQYRIPFSSDNGFVSEMKITPKQNGDMSFYNYKADPVSEKLPDNVQGLYYNSKNITNEALAKRLFGMESKFINADVVMRIDSLELPESDYGDTLSLISYEGLWQIKNDFIIKSQNPVLEIAANDISANALYGMVLNKRYEKSSDQLSGTTLSFQIDRISPVPFQSYLTIDVMAPSDNTIAVKLIGTDGKEYFEEQYPVSKGLSKITLNNLESLSAGVYFIQLSGFKQSLTRKIIHY